MNMLCLDRLQSIISYHFSSIEYLEQALTHTSRLNEPGSGTADYQRLEFLGDAILGMFLAEMLFRQFPDAREGELSRMRSLLAGQGTLAKIAREHGIGEFIRVGRGEELCDGRNKDSILCDVLEALIAAVYLDGGMERARELVEWLFSGLILSVAQVPGLGDCKSEFQERLASHGYPPPVYRMVAEKGPPHERVFEFEVEVDGRCFGRGSGKSKKLAQQEAASNALAHLMEQGSVE